MPSEVTEYRCLLVSPSDLSEERERFEKVVRMWNAFHGRGIRVRISTVRWEVDGVPEFGEPAQSALNRQLVDEADFGVAMFWHRLGTPTDSSASGSIEEISRLHNAGKPVQIYLSLRPYPHHMDPAELSRLRRCMEGEVFPSALVHRYESFDNWEGTLAAHLSSVIDRLQRERVNAADPPNPRGLSDDAVRMLRYMYDEDDGSLELFQSEKLLSPLGFDHASMEDVANELKDAGVIELDEHMSPRFYANLRLRSAAFGALGPERKRAVEEAMNRVADALRETREPVEFDTLLARLGLSDRELGHAVHALAGMGMVTILEDMSHRLGMRLVRPEPKLRARFQPRSTE